MIIPHTVRIKNGKVSRDGTQFITDSALVQPAEPELLYTALNGSYPKFFKMDLLCKWAWLGAEILLKSQETTVTTSPDRSAVVLHSHAGCWEADKRYQDSISSFASPALFVYTLPNIMLGEICIRHGFKGEQLCLIQENFDIREQLFWVRHLMEEKGMEACLGGWVDVTAEAVDIFMYWALRKENSSPKTIESVLGLLERHYAS